MNDRLKELRTSLKLSQKNFGAKINLSPDMISLLEKGKRSFTERVIADICREFNINKEWLLNGNGEMFNNILEEIPGFKNANEDVQEIVKLYLELDDVTKAYYKRKIKDEIESQKRAGR